MKRRAFVASSKRQHGAVLFVSLIILVVLTLLAVTTANTALLENRMASAARNRQLAEFAAGSAISEARQRVLAIASTSGAAAVCAQLRCLVREPGWPERAAELVEVPAVRTAMNGLPVDFTKFDGVDASARLAASPGFLVEDLGTHRSLPPAAGARRAFRITAVGTGATAEAASVIEAVQDVQE